MKNPIAWFEIYVNDLDRAKKFYQTVFEISFEKLTDPSDSGVEMWSFPSDFEQYGSSGALVKMHGCAAGVGGTMIYFSCDDCALEESRVLSAGGSIQQSKMDIGDFGFCTLAVDTEGNMFGLHSDK